MNRRTSSRASARAPPDMDEEPTLPIAAGQSNRPAPPPITTRWGDFTLLARVGFGGFGEVYRAWDPR